MAQEAVGLRGSEVGVKQAAFPWWYTFKPRPPKNRVMFGWARCHYCGGKMVGAMWEHPDRKPVLLCKQHYAEFAAVEFPEKPLRPS